MDNLVYYCTGTISPISKAEWYVSNIPNSAIMVSPDMGFVNDNIPVPDNCNMYTQWKRAEGGVYNEFGCNLQKNVLLKIDDATLLNELNLFNYKSIYGDRSDEFRAALLKSINDIHNWYYTYPTANTQIRNGLNYTLSGKYDLIQTNSADDAFSSSKTWGNSLTWSGFLNSGRSSSAQLKMALFSVQKDISDGLISVSDELKSLLNNTLKSGVISTRAVDWIVNIDGSKNPNITRTYKSTLEEITDESSVMIRAYASAEPGHIAVVDASKFIGRYDYDAQPITYSWNKIYSESGTGANYLDDALKFAKNLIGKLFTNSGAAIELLFNMTYIQDGTIAESSWCYAQIDYYGNVSYYGVVGGQFNDGSTVTITKKNTDDIYEEFADDLDDIDSTNYGVSALSLLTQTYVLTSSRLKQFGHFLWDRSFADAILNINQSPIENVISCKVFPFEIKGGADANIILGNVNTGVIGAAITENTNFVIDVGNFTIPKKYNNWIDYTMTTIGIFLPMCGFFSLDANVYMGKLLNVKYYIDILTGVCKATISINNIPVQEFGGQIGFDIPLTSQNRAQTELAQITSFASGVSSLASGNLSGGLSGVLHGVIRPKDNFQTAGSLSPTCNMMTTHDVFIVIERPIVQYPSNYGHIYGYPCYLKKTLNNLSGFTQCENVDVSGISCTNEEKDLIKRELETGIYIQ